MHLGGFSQEAVVVLSYQLKYKVVLEGRCLKEVKENGSIVLNSK